MRFLSFQNLLLGTKYIGIEHFTIGDEEKCAILLAEKKKGELLIRQKDKVRYTDKFPDNWNKKLPFFITINNKQVIQKEIAGTDASDGKLLHKAFPNIAWNEFYYEIWRLKTKSLIAISRKIYVDTLLESYQTQGILINGFSLGVTGLSGLQEYTDIEQLTTNTQTVSFSESDNCITLYEKPLPVTYNLNELEIENSQLLPFSGILKLILLSGGTTSNFSDRNAQLSDAYHQASFFRNGLKTAIGSLLLLLLINFFIFNHYYKKTQAISEEIEINKSTLEAVQKTKEHIRIKEQTVKSIGDLTTSKSSLHINEMVKHMPSSILLSELIFNPVEKKIKPGESVQTQDKTLLVSGKVIDNSAITVWIEMLENLKWVDRVVITHFGKDENGETVFSLKVTLKGNETR